MSALSNAEDRADRGAAVAFCSGRPRTPIPAGGEIFGHHGGSLQEAEWERRLAQAL